MKTFYVHCDNRDVLDRVAGQISDFFKVTGLRAQADSIIKLNSAPELAVKCTQAAMDSFRSIGDKDGIVQIEPEVILVVRKQVDGAGPVNLLK